MFCGVKKVKENYVLKEEFVTVLSYFEGYIN